MPFFIINIMDSIDIILLQREVSKYKAPPNGKIFQIIITITWDTHTKHDPFFYTQKSTTMYHYSYLSLISI